MDQSDVIRFAAGRTLTKKNSGTKVGTKSPAPANAQPYTLAGAGLLVSTSIPFDERRASKRPILPRTDLVGSVVILRIRLMSATPILRSTLLALSLLASPFNLN